MILFRADANSSIGMGHIMRCLSIADAISSITSEPTIVSGKNSIKFVLADDGVAKLIKDRGYEPIVLHTDYKAMDSEIPVWEELADSIDADLIIVDSYFVTDHYLSWLKENIGFLAYIDDVLSFPYPADILVNYNAYANLRDYQELYQGRKAPEFLLGVEYAPLRSMFQNIPPREQREEVKDVLLSTGGSDELHIALEFVKYLCDHPSSFIYHILLGAMNPDKPAIREIADKMPNVVIHENVADMKSLICSMDLVISAAGSTLYEICACGTPLITFSTADNQIPGATAFSTLGLAINIGDLRDPSSIIPGAVMSGTLASNAIEKLIIAMRKLAADKPARVAMSKSEQGMIDARGAERLAKELVLQIKGNLIVSSCPF